MSQVQYILTLGDPGQCDGFYAYVSLFVFSKVFSSTALSYNKGLSVISLLCLQQCRTTPNFTPHRRK